METEHNIMPEIRLLRPVERLRRLGTAVLDYLSFPVIGEESTRPRGASAMLDRALDEPEEFYQPALEYDDMGNYHNPNGEM